VFPWVLTCVGELQHGITASNQADPSVDPMGESLGVSPWVITLGDPPAGSAGGGGAPTWRLQGSASGRFRKRKGPQSEGCRLHLRALPDEAVRKPHPAQGTKMTKKVVSGPN
jgi:hypothetical protein